METTLPYTFSENKGMPKIPVTRECWLMGLLTCDMSGHTHPAVKRPFLIIEAGTLLQAEDVYNELVALTSYYPCHPVAHHCEGQWSLCTDFMSPSAMETILHELMSDPKGFTGHEDNR